MCTRVYVCYLISNRKKMDLNVQAGAFICIFTCMYVYSYKWNHGDGMGGARRHLRMYVYMYVCVLLEMKPQRWIWRCKKASVCSYVCVCLRMYVAYLSPAQQKYIHAYMRICT
jgi:hypothetical protein